MKKNENILLQMHRHEAKAGIRRTSVEHGLGTTAKWVYILGTVWTLLMNVIYFLSVYVQRGHTLDVQDGKDMSVIFEDYIASASGSLVLVFIMTLIIIFGVFAFKKRWYIPCAIANVLPAIILILHFKTRMSDLFAVSEGIPLSFVFRPLLPLLLLIVGAATYSVIGILYNVSENRAYENFVAKIYEQHPDRFGKMTDEEWDEFLNNYNPPSRKDAKKARKKAAGKTEKEAE
jgi:hypothetical protein